MASFMIQVALILEVHCLTDSRLERFGLNHVLLTSQFIIHWNEKLLDSEEISEVVFSQE